VRVCLPVCLCVYVCVRAQTEGLLQWQEDGKVASGEGREDEGGGGEGAGAGGGVLLKGVEDMKYSVGLETLGSSGGPARVRGGDKVTHTNTHTHDEVGGSSRERDVGRVAEVGVQTELTGTQLEKGGGEGGSGHGMSQEEEWVRQRRALRQVVVYA
jgi:hypothetical protein